jgi:hypothetical protein
MMPPAKFLIPEGKRIFSSLCLKGLAGPTGEFGMTGLARGLPGYGIPTPKAGFPK